MKNKVSELMDGELDAEDAAGLIAQLRQANELRDDWATYHLIGDAMRQSTLLPLDITRRVSEKLASEPTVLAPRPPVTNRVRVFALSAAASVAAVAMVGWMSLQTMDTPQPNLAASKPPSQTTAQALPATSSIPAPAQINDYLLAHQEFSPSTAIQGVAPYVRTVADSYERPAR